MSETRGGAQCKEIICFHATHSKLLALHEMSTSGAVSEGDKVRIADVYGKCSQLLLAEIMRYMPASDAAKLGRPLPQDDGA